MEKLFDKLRRRECKRIIRPYIYFFDQNDPLAAVSKDVKVGRFLLTIAALLQECDKETVKETLLENIVEYSVKETIQFTVRRAGDYIASPITNEDSIYADIWTIDRLEKTLMW